ncbi:class I SAM-dependent methyltransferase (plasmid) [Arthrobacter agilis]|uniref:class I SAM-dependent methyltransferase n=1 Tax=Arthrobacter agilis TaxID=37921 RepID=UPI0023662AA5|nr:class I SAM-dependent methyltransferase [Arthrobacter agilis]WDF35066.1 class I SAM-dependent methyltransferase [Arthrobacter agilis]
MGNEVRNAYSRRAAEYTELFGSTSFAHPSDRQLISSWAHNLEGEVVDVGCGPGHWTNFLTEYGVAARGVDLVPEFIDRAHRTYPGVPFTVGSFDTLGVETGTIGGVLSWYSLIHHEPSTISIPLAEFSRVISPGGGLLIGFFESPMVEGFAHAVAPAYRWPVSDLSEELKSVGFDVVETHIRTTKGQRPHAAIIARRREEH